MKNVILILATGLAISGCSATTSSYQPIVLTQQSGFETEIVALRLELSDLEPNSRLYRGMTIADARCDKFFNDLEAIRARVRFGGRQVTSLSTGLPTLMNAAKASSLSVSAVSAALGFVSGLLTDYDELFLLSKFKGAVYKKWQVAREDASQRIDDLILEAGPSQLPDEYANRQLYRYSSLCLHSQLTNWLHQAANGGVIMPIDGEESQDTNKFKATAKSRVTESTSFRNRNKRGARSRARSVPAYIISN